MSEFGESSPWTESVTASGRHSTFLAGYLN